jgi:hypothetical protein
VSGSDASLFTALALAAVVRAALLLGETGTVT